MAYIGEIGKRLTVTVTFKKSFEYTDYNFSFYGTTHYIHTFEDNDGNVIVWKSTNCVGTLDPEYGVTRPITKGSVVELTGTVKDHSQYKGTEQTVVTRCKFKVVQHAKTYDEIQQEKADAQLASLTGEDFIWEMPYKQYKEHYSDCETIVGSFNAHEDTDGIRYAEPTIKVIIREGRLKNSGVRGEHFYTWYFVSPDGKHRPHYRAVSEENARKRMKKDFPDSEGWECTRIHNPRDYPRYF